jgi:fructose-1,6-bisphosphatase/inositol monophosphatase family enzyme
MDLMTLGEQCILEAMKVLKNASAEIIQFKGPTKNVQITADLAANEVIIKILKKSGNDFFIISEEEKELIKIGKNPEIEVYIDPLDGSDFFLSGHKRFCCTALMFVQKGKVLASFVGDLITNDIYSCDTKFAYFNNQKISFSLKKKGGRYMVAAYAIKGQRIKKELPKIAELAQNQIIIFNNSGPLEQALITTGRFDAVVDFLPVHLWDSCGVAIAQKAGAIVTTREGSPFQYKNIKQAVITARNSELHKMLLNALN